MFSLGKKVPGSSPKGSADVPVSGGYHRRMQESHTSAFLTPINAALTSSIYLVPCSLLFQLVFLYCFSFFSWTLNLFDLLEHGACFLYTNNICRCPSCFPCVWALSQPAAELVIISLHVGLPLTASNKFSLAPKGSCKLLFVCPGKRFSCCY